MKLCAALLLSLMCFAGCYGQGPGASKEARKLMDTMQIADYVVDIFEDSKGNLWMATVGNGAALYNADGLSYYTTKEGLAGDEVVSITEDKDGNIWLGTHTGASRYDGNTFTNFGPEHGLTGMGCYILVGRNGNIWAGTNDGVFKYDGKAFSKFNLPLGASQAASYKWIAGKIWSLIEDKSGNIWFGTDGYGAFKYNGQLFTRFTKKDGLVSNNVGSICEDNNGNIWFGCLSSDHPEYKNEGGLCSYDGTTFTQHADDEGVVNRDFYTIYADRTGNVWAGAAGYGAYLYDGKHLTVYTETDRQDLTNNFALQSILEDRKGTLWFGFSGGLFRFDGSAFINVNRHDLVTK